MDTSLTGSKATSSVVDKNCTVRIYKNTVFIQSTGDVLMRKLNMFRKTGQFCNVTILVPKNPVAKGINEKHVENDPYEEVKESGQKNSLQKTDCNNENKNKVTLSQNIVKSSGNINENHQNDHEIISRSNLITDKTSENKNEVTETSENILGMNQANGTTNKDRDGKTICKNSDNADSSENIGENSSGNSDNKNITKNKPKSGVKSDNTLDMNLTNENIVEVNQISQNASENIDSNYASQNSPNGENMSENRTSKTNNKNISADGSKMEDYTMNNDGSKMEDYTTNNDENSDEDNKTIDENEINNQTVSEDCLDQAIDYSIKSKSSKKVKRLADFNQILAHSCVISTGSELFYSVLTNPTTEKYCNKRIIIDNVCMEHLQQCISYLYGNAVVFNKKDIDDFMLAAKMLKIKTLENQCKLAKVFLDKSINTDSTVYALEKITQESKPVSKVVAKNGHAQSKDNLSRKKYSHKTRNVSSTGDQYDKYMEDNEPVMTRRKRKAVKMNPKMEPVVKLKVVETKDKGKVIETRQKRKAVEVKENRIETRQKRKPVESKKSKTVEVKENRTIETRRTKKLVETKQNNKQAEMNEKIKPVDSKQNRKSVEKTKKETKQESLISINVQDEIKEKLAKVTGAQRKDQKWQTKKQGEQTEENNQELNLKPEKKMDADSSIVSLQSKERTDIKDLCARLEKRVHQKNTITNKSVVKDTRGSVVAKQSSSSVVKDRSDLVDTNNSFAEHESDVSNSDTSINNSTTVVLSSGKHQVLKLPTPVEASTLTGKTKNVKKKKFKEALGKTNSTEVPVKDVKISSLNQAEESQVNPEIEGNIIGTITRSNSIIDYIDSIITKNEAHFKPNDSLLGKRMIKLTDDLKTKLADDSKSKFAGDSKTKLAGNSKSKLADDSKTELAGNSKSKLADDSTTKLADDSKIKLPDDSNAISADDSDHEDIMDDNDSTGENCDNDNTKDPEDTEAKPAELTSTEPQSENTDATKMTETLLTQAFLQALTQSISVDPSAQLASILAVPLNIPVLPVVVGAQAGAQQQIPVMLLPQTSLGIAGLSLVNTGVDNDQTNKNGVNIDESAEQSNIKNKQHNNQVSREKNNKNLAADSSALTADGDNNNDDVVNNLEIPFDFNYKFFQKSELFKTRRMYPSDFPPKRKGKHVVLPDDEAGRALFHHSYAFASAERQARNAVTAHTNMAPKKYPNSEQSKRYHRFQATMPKKCNHCDELFKSLKSYYNHMRKVRKKFVNCKYCDFKTTDSSVLRLHEQRHRQEKHFKCNLCDFRACTKKEVEMHRVIHTKEREFICEMCGKDFRRRQTLRTHRLREHGVGNRKNGNPACFECKLCNFKHPSMSVIKNHQISHSSERNHLCSLCGRTYKRSHQLRRHRRNVHKIVDPVQSHTVNKLKVIVDEEWNLVEKSINKKSIGSDSVNQETDGISIETESKTGSNSVTQETDGISIETDSKTSIQKEGKTYVPLNTNLIGNDDDEIRIDFNDSECTEIVEDVEVNTEKNPYEDKITFNICYEEDIGNTEVVVSDADPIGSTIALDKDLLNYNNDPMGSARTKALDKSKRKQSRLRDILQEDNITINFVEEMDNENQQSSCVTNHKLQSQNFQEITNYKEVKRGDTLIRYRISQGEMKQVLDKPRDPNNCNSEISLGSSNITIQQQSRSNSKSEIKSNSKSETISNSRSETISNFQSETIAQSSYTYYQQQSSIQESSSIDISDFNDLNNSDYGSMYFNLEYGNQQQEVNDNRGGSSSLDPNDQVIIDSLNQIEATEVAQHLDIMDSYSID